jgi:intracellular sulfur oxidation DsrE/DsrF family protein
MALSFMEVSMKSLVAFSCVIILTVVALVARAQSPQPQPYKVVFDLTSADPADQQAVLRWIREITALNPKTETEVVMYGRGLDLVTSGKTTLASGITEAMSSAHATFKVCEIAMKNQHVDKSQLLANVQTVPDGIGEIVAKQHAGWGYIKVGH